jgi:hypothetical protein
LWLAEQAVPFICAGAVPEDEERASSANGNRSETGDDGSEEKPTAPPTGHLTENPLDLTRFCRELPPLTLEHCG